MTAKEVLLQLARKDARIEGMRERLQRYRELAEGQRARLRSLPGGGQRRTSSVEEYVSKIVDLTRAIDAAIAALKDQRFQDLLRWRYMDGWRWERIGRAMGYEQRQVYRLHALALSAFARAWGADDCA